MNAPRLTASVLAMLLATAPALAETATPDGAKALDESFAAYFGQSAIDRGLITVMPQGDAYLVNFDLQRVADGFNVPGVSLRVGSWSCLTAQLPDGTWSVKSDNFPHIAFRAPVQRGDAAKDEFSGTLPINGFVLLGLLDATLTNF